MEQQTRLRSNRYETGLLWKTNDVVLPDNYEAAVQRHQSFMRKLRRTPELWLKLTVLMEAYANKGYVWQVDPWQVSQEIIAFGICLCLQ